MKRKHRSWYRFQCMIRKIHLVDRFLILFMMVLLMQSAYSLFSKEEQTIASGSIDTMVRTSTAGIFGYFISANFMRKCASGQEEPQPGSPLYQAPPAKQPDAPHAVLGFQPPGDQMEQQGLAQETTCDTAGNCWREPPEDGISCVHVQVAVVSIIGLVSLIMILLFRNSLMDSIAGIPTISQLRDFVSGCIGFLIGSETSGKAAETRKP